MSTLSILFFGDIVGKPGRLAVKAYLNQLQDKPDVVIANVENVSHGFGLTRKNYDELSEMGINIMTSGNHIWDKKEIVNFIDEVGNVLRPFNMIGKTAVGKGHGVFEVNGHKIGVLNAIGQVFMGNYNSPWNQLDELMSQLKAETPIVFVDFHAEATAEKAGLGYYLANQGASAFTGTHTHVQTADERILNGQMGFITDSGFCGAHDSVIGMDKEAAIQRLKDPYPVRLDIPETSVVQVNGSRFEIDAETGKCVRVSRVNMVFNLDHLLVA